MDVVLVLLLGFNSSKFYPAITNLASSFN